MLLYNALAWGFVTFTFALCLGIIWLWWLERHTDRP